MQKIHMKCTMQCRVSAHRAKATRDDLRNVVPDFAVEKTSGSTAAVTEQDGDQFSTLSVEHLLRLLITLWIFAFDV